MKRIIAGLALVLLSAGSLFAQNPDAVVFTGGDVHITGTGNGLVFPDSSVQTSAAQQGPAGPANTLAIGTVTTGASGSQAAATITGTSPNQTLNLTIPQGPAGTGPGIVILTPSKNLRLGDTLQLTATSLGPTNNQLSSGSYTWASITPSVASVSGSGLVTALAAGSAIITVRDTANNVSGQLAVTVKSMTGDWVSSNNVIPTSTCPGMAICSLHIVENANGSGTVTTNSCADSCGNTFNISGSSERTGSTSTMASGTFIFTPLGGSPISFGISCKDTWDGNNSLNSMCVIPGFANPVYANSSNVFISNYVRD